MRKILFFLVVISFQTAFSQTDEEYSASLQNAIEAINGHNGKKLFDQFSPEFQSAMPLEKLNELINEKVEDYGKLSEFDFMDEDEEGKRYLVQTDIDSFIVVLRLSSDKKITNFQIE